MSLWSSAKRCLPVMPGTANSFGLVGLASFVQDLSTSGDLGRSDATSDSLGLVARVGCESRVGFHAELRNPGTACLLRSRNIVPVHISNWHFSDIAFVLGDVRS